MQCVLRSNSNHVHFALLLIELDCYVDSCDIGQECSAHNSTFLTNRKHHSIINMFQPEIAF